MRRFRVLASATLLAAALGSAPVAGQEPDPGVAALDRLAVPLVAERWDVPPQSLSLVFGTLPAGWVADTSAAAELLGSGSGGYWVLRVRTTGGDAGSVRFRAGVRTRVPVAARALRRGHTLVEGDITQVDSLRWGRPEREARNVEPGWVTRRVLDAGDVLRTPAVQPPLAVRTGEAVSLIWKRDGVGLRVAGQAAGSALLGEEVLVRTESGSRLKGVVVAPGIVNVTPGGREP